VCIFTELAFWTDTFITYKQVMWQLYYVVHGREMRKCMSRSGSDPPRYRCGAHEGEGVGPLRRRCEDGPGGAVTAL